METPAHFRATRREWLGLAVLALPCLIYSMDLTVLDLALPSIAASLRPSGVELLWIVDIYGFFVAASLVTLGALGDRFGRRRVLLLGALGFAAMSTLAAFATSARMMIVARALMGLAGASLAPSTLALIRTLFRQPEQRTVAVGVWIASYSLGGALGPLVGGAVLSHFRWGTVFLLAVPVMILLLAVGPRVLPEARDPAAARVDVLSATLSLASILSMIHGMKRLAVAGPSGSVAVAVLAAIGFGTLFARRQRTLTTPLVDIGLFRRPALTAVFLAYGLASFAGLSVFLFIAQYLELVVELSPVQAGVWIMPFALTFVLGSIVTPIVARRVPHRPLMVGGLILASAGVLLLATLDGTGWKAALVTGLVLFAAGLCPVCVLAPDVMVASAPAERAGAVAALTETGAELGGALGIALLGSLGTAVYRAALGAHPPTGISPATFERARGSIIGSADLASHLPARLSEALETATHVAFVSALRTVATAASVVTLASALMVWHFGSAGQPLQAAKT